MKHESKLGGGFDHVNSSTIRGQQPRIEDVIDKVAENQYEEEMQKVMRKKAPQSYQPQFILEQNKKNDEAREALKKYNWQKQNPPNVLETFLIGLFDKYNGDKAKINEAIHKYKKDGTINELQRATKFDIKSMIDDKISFMG